MWIKNGDSKGALTFGELPELPEATYSPKFAGKWLNFFGFWIIIDSMNRLNLNWKITFLPVIKRGA